MTSDRWNKPIFTENTGPATLNLKDNNISVPTEAMMQDFAEVKALVLKNNPMACDCGNINFLRWLREQSQFPRMKVDCGGPAEWAGQSVWEFYAGKEAAVCRTQGPEVTNNLENKADVANKGKVEDGRRSRQKVQAGLSRNSASSFTSIPYLVILMTLVQQRLF